MRRRAEFRIDGLTEDDTREWTRHGPSAPRAGLLIGTLSALAVVYVYGQAGPTVDLVPRVDFGDQPLQAVTHIETVHVTNRGASRLHISEVVLEGFHLDDFVVSDNTCTRSVLESEGDCLIQVQFTPKGEGPRSAQLVITDNARDSPQRVTLSGVGVEQPAAVARTEIAPAPVDFGSQEVSRPPSTRTVRVTNVGTGPLEVHRVAVRTADEREFTVLGETCTGAPIPPDRDCTILIQFTPQDRGARAAQLIIAHSAADAPQAVALSGVGTVEKSPVPAPRVEIAPSPVDFGQRDMGQPGIRLTVRIRNPGTAPLEVKSMTISGPAERDFTVAEQRCTQAVLGPGATCTVLVEFTPRVRGLRSAELVLADNAVGSPHQVGLRGAGEERPAPTPVPRVEITPNPVDFGRREVGQAGPTQTVRVGNSGTAPLQVRNVRPSGSEAGEFDVRSETCTRGPVASGTSCAVVVEFTPRGRGVRSGTLVLADNAAGSPHQVGLNGVGEESPKPDPLPRVEITPNPLEFGRREVGRPGLRQAVRMSNVGTGPLVVTSVRARGAEAPEFDVTSETCTQGVVASGSACTIVVEFTPRGSGVRTAELLLADNAAGSPHQVGLRGSGEAGRGPAPVPRVEFAPNPVDFGRRELGRPGARRTVQVSNVGAGPLLVRSVRPTGAEAGEFDVLSETCTRGAITPGASCTVAVEFTPRARGVRGAELLVVDNAAGSPHPVGLRGVGEERPGPVPQPRVEIMPNPVAFGRRGAGSGTREAVRVRNSGAGPLDVKDVTITGADERDFVVTNQTCTRGSVAPGESCGIVVEFRPRGAGSRGAQILITDNAPGNPHRVLLSGTSREAPPTPGVKVAPGAVNFGSGVVGRTRIPSHVQVMSVGTGALQVTRITSGGANAQDFTVVNETCAASPIRPDTSCTIVVEFKPQGAGPRSGYLMFTDNAPGSPHRIALTGEGIAPSSSRTPDTPSRALDIPSGAVATPRERPRPADTPRATPRVFDAPRQLDAPRLDPMGWCCAGGNVLSLSKRACTLKNGTFHLTQDAARRQCTPVIR